MHSDLYEKFKESAISVVPVMLLVVILNFTIAPLNNGQLPQFLLGGALLISGLAIFLLGAEIGMVPFGQKVGSSLTYMRNLALILIAAFAIGFAVTVAEPDVQVLATQVNGVLPSLNKNTLLFSIAVGVGFFCEYRHFARGVPFTIKHFIDCCLYFGFFCWPHRSTALL